jgi:hypothetical protein
METEEKYPGEKKLLLKKQEIYFSLSTDRKKVIFFFLSKEESHIKIRKIVLKGWRSLSVIPIHQGIYLMVTDQIYPLVTTLITYNHAIFIFIFIFISFFFLWVEFIKVHPICLKMKG